MKNTIKIIGIIALAAVIVFTMAACGGGGGVKKSGLRTDGFFGALPAIFADHNLADEAVRERHRVARERAEQRQNVKAFQKANDDFSQGLSDLGSKLETDVAAEAGRLSGKDVPFTVSDNFREFNVVSLKVNDTGNLALTATNVRRNMMGVTSYRFRAVASDGSVIIEHIAYGSEVVNVTGAMRSEPEKWVDFERIEFFNAQ